MISSRQRINRFMKLKIRWRLRVDDINFLRRCEREKVFPKFIDNGIKVKNMSHGAQEGAKKAKKFWLKNEIKRHHGSNMRDAREIYSLQLSLMRELSQIEWKNLIEKIDSVTLGKHIRKTRRLKEKFRKIKIGEFPKKRSDPPPSPTFPFVINRSTASFTPEEMTLLNKGLKYVPPPPKIPYDEIVVAVETVIKTASIEEKSCIRSECREAIKKERLKKTNDHETIKSLKKKEVVYSHPDKGKGVVIMDKDDYMNAMKRHIEEGPYEEIKIRCKIPVDDPQGKVKRELSKMVSSQLINEEMRRKLSVTNPRIPRMYGLPKTHKPGFQIRPVVTTIDDPTCKIAKFLTKYFNSFRKFPSRSIKNSLEFTKLMNEVKIEENEEMISFDVQALYPSIPEEESTLLLKEWICDQEISNKQTEMLCDLLDIVVNQKIFQFDGKFYKQLEGVKIGGTLSSWQAEIFMSKLETKYLTRSWAPKTYVRYVDDIFCIIKKGEAESILQHLNNQHKNIVFTCEREKEGKLPFLDLLVERRNNKMVFNIYRKSSDAPLTIPKDSHCPHQYKYSAYESMLHRLYNMPITKESFECERKYIFHTAKLNGYEEEEIERLEKKHKNREKIKEITTLSHQNENKTEKKLLIMGYHPPTTEKIKKSVKKKGINSVYSSGLSLGRLLINLKDKRQNYMKSGIYKIECSTCDMKYIGQSKRRAQVRWKEHEAAFRLKQPNKSAVADHMLKNKHDIGEKRLIKEITNPCELDAWESYYIQTTKDLMNQEEAPIRSNLFSIAHNTTHDNHQ